MRPPRALLVFLLLAGVAYGHSNERQLPGAMMDAGYSASLSAQVEYLTAKGIHRFFFRDIPPGPVLSHIHQTGGVAVVSLPGPFLTPKTQAKPSFKSAIGQIPFNTLDAHPAVAALCMHWCVSDAASTETLLQELLPASLRKKRVAVRYNGYESGSTLPFFELITRTDSTALAVTGASGFLLDTRMFPETDPVQLMNLVLDFSARPEPFFVDAGWLESQFRSNAFFGLPGEIRFPADEPSQSGKPRSTGAIAFLLTMIWLWFGARFYNDPTYRKSIGRFFFNHSFHASDVFNRRIRLSYSAWVLTIQSIALFGLALETVFLFVVTPVERAILVANVPFIARAASVPFGFFLTGAAFQAALIAISLIWLRIGLPGTRSFGQILPIYAWTFHIHLVVIPLIIVLCITGWTLGFVILWAVTVLTGLTLFSFFLVSWNVLRFAPSHSRRIYLYNMVPFTLFVSGFYLLLYFRTSLVEAIVYAASLH